ncbi:unnamed protein product [Prorocentrum cordatum]|uniref:Uncharacterized protein n=1 Tax=Prorocentrum cordatum TaxID=2364126 RepID=A0ABN9XI02_9DINO|nr:unnamed protein product [Polarella glacialis]
MSRGGGLHNLSATTLRDEIAALVPSAAQWESARKALRSWQMETDDNKCKLLLVLRNHKERVYAADIRRAQAKVVEVQEDYLLRKVWLVKKSMNPEVGTKVPLKWQIDPQSVERFPAGVARDEVWVIDSGYPRHELGPGVLEFHMKIGQREEWEPTPAAALEDGPAPDPPAARVPRPSAGAAPGPSGGAGVASTAAAPGPALKKKVLRDRTSDPKDKLSLEEIAQSAKAEADKGRFTSDNKASNENLLFWCGEFLVCLRESKVADPIPTSIPKHLKFFIDFVVEDCLLDTNSYPHLHAFAPFLKDCEAVYSDALSAYGKGVLAVATVPLGGNAGVQVPGLLGRKSHRFHTSPFMMGFQKANNEKMYSDLESAHQMTDAERVAKISSLLTSAGADTKSASALDESKSTALQVMATLLGQAPDATKFTYLIDDLSRYDALQAWSPAHALFDLKQFALVQPRWKDMQVGKIVAGIKTLSKNEDVLAKIPSPVMRGIAGDYRKLAAFASEQEDQGAWQAVAEDLLREILESKLGLKPESGGRDPQWPALFGAAPAAALKALYKIVGIASKKFQERGGTCLGALRASHSKADEIVMITMRKKEWDGMKCKVIRCNASQVVCEVLEGTTKVEKGTKRSFSIVNVKKTTAAPESELAKRLKTGGAPASEDEKNAQTQANMEKIFGKKKGDDED